MAKASETAKRLKGEKWYYYFQIAVTALVIMGILISSGAYMMMLRSDITNLSDDMKTLGENLEKLKPLQTKMDAFDKDMTKIDNKITVIQNQIVETSQNMALMLRDLLKKQ